MMKEKFSYKFKKAREIIFLSFYNLIRSFYKNKNTDFQEIIPKINYYDFKKYLGEKKSKLRKSTHFLETFQIYLDAKKKLIFIRLEF